MTHNKISGREIQVAKGRRVGHPRGAWEFCPPLLTQMLLLYLAVHLHPVNTLAGKTVPNRFLGSVLLSSKGLRTGSGIGHLWSGARSYRVVGVHSGDSLMGCSPGVMRLA